MASDDGYYRLRMHCLSLLLCILGVVAANEYFPSFKYISEHRQPKYYGKGYGNEHAYGYGSSSSYGGQYYGGNKYVSGHGEYGGYGDNYGAQPNYYGGKSSYHQDGYYGKPFPSYGYGHPAI